jgi:hypothetical protein
MQLYLRDAKAGLAMIATPNEEEFACLERKNW